MIEPVRVVVPALAVTVYVNVPEPGLGLEVILIQASDFVAPQPHFDGAVTSMLALPSAAVKSWLVQESEQRRGRRRVRNDADTKAAWSDRNHASLGCGIRKRPHGNVASEVHANEAVGLGAGLPEIELT